MSLVTRHLSGVRTEIIPTFDPKGRRLRGNPYDARADFEGIFDMHLSCKSKKRVETINRHD